MTDIGFIVIHRKILNWEWYTDDNTFKVFMHLLLTANFADQKFKGIIIKRGQRVASYETLAKETGLSVRNVRTAIEHLKSTNEVTSSSTPNYTVFTVVKYADYQGKRQTKRQTTDKPPTNDRQTTDNDITIYNKENKENSIDTHDVGRFEPPDGQCPGGIIYGNEGVDA